MAFFLRWEARMFLVPLFGCKINPECNMWDPDMAPVQDKPKKRELAALSVIRE